MKSGNWLLAAVVGVSLLQAGAAYAYKDEAIVKAENKADFSAVVAAVHQQMATGGRYEFVATDERAKIDSNFSDMQSLFDKYGSLAQMPQSAKVQLFNEQEAINAILTRRDANRKICTSEAPMGSLISRMKCRTYREVEQNRRDAQQFMQRSNPVPQTKSGGG